MYPIPKSIQQCYWYAIYRLADSVAKKLVHRKVPYLIKTKINKCGFFLSLHPHEPGRWQAMPRLTFGAKDLASHTTIYVRLLEFPDRHDESIFLPFRFPVISLRKANK